MVAEKSNEARKLALTDEQRMLVEIRDTLYEGSWDDFLADLTARAEGKAHVFALTAPSSQLKSTIQRHVDAIEALRGWERDHHQTLTT